jgi:hypothetical protein
LGVETAPTPTYDGSCYAEHQGERPKHTGHWIVNQQPYGSSGDYHQAEENDNYVGAARRLFGVEIVHSMGSL